VERAERSLRFIIERPSYLDERAEGMLPAFAARRGRSLVCPVCARTPQDAGEGCVMCGWPRLRRLPFQRRLGRFFQSALREDPKFVARVKAEQPTLPDEVVCKHFTGPLACLEEAWRRAHKPTSHQLRPDPQRRERRGDRPQGQPFDPERHWRVVFAIETTLMSWYKLTRTEAVNTVLGDQWPPGPLRRRHDGVERPAYTTGELLNKVGNDIRKSLSYEKPDSPSLEEIFRSLRWAKRQRECAAARWGGERVRVRSQGTRARRPGPP
jgi:hypothetical protein